MRRRDFLALGGAALALPSIALAQQTKVWRIAIVGNAIPDDPRKAMLDGLTDYGYVDGKTVSIQLFNAPSIDDVPAYAARAVASQPDIIVTEASAAPLALKELTNTIPVVMANLSDPVAIGAVASYAHPSGNITGFMSAGPLYSAKQIELIREVLPAVGRLALLGLPSDPPYPVTLQQYVTAAKALNIETIEIAAVEGQDLVPLFDRAKASGAQAILVSGAGYLRLNYALTADLALQRRLPAFHGQPAAVSSGLLLAYGANTIALARQAMSYVDAILKGAKPGDLPIQQPTTFDLAINLKTAQALGITFPQSILLRATQVIS